MTRAWELFQNSRRSRFGRSSSSSSSGGGGHFGLGDGGGEEPPLDSSSSYSLFHRTSHPNSRRDRHHATHHYPSTISASTANSRRDHPHIDGRDPLPRRVTHPRHQLPHRHLLHDRESGWLDQGGSSSALEDVNNSPNGSTLRDRLSSAGNDRLPGTVLLARERLLQRLRGVSLSANRQSNGASSIIHHNDFTIENDIRLADVEEWENEISREWLVGTISFTDILSTEKSKRPPGLTQDALDSLRVEMFSKLDNSDEEATLKGLEDCSICLESFLEGDKLIYLTCGHRFHFYCLDPWVRICGDCPNCRKAVLITSCSAEERVQSVSS